MSPPDRAGLIDLVDAARAGRPRAVGRLISLVENDAPQLRDLMALLAADTGRARVVGLTGAPGVGKSTTVAALVTALRSREQRVAVLAVDPSSPFSGGALLGDRVRMQQLALSTVALGQGMAFFNAGSDILRSKSLDRNSYDSGDHFNALDWTYGTNNFGVGLPPAWDNEPKWPFMQPLLADPLLRPSQGDIEASAARFRDLLRIADSSPLFNLTTAEQVQQKVRFLNTGPDQTPGLIVMHLDDTVGRNLDRRLDGVVVVFNAGDEAQSFTAEELRRANVQLSPVQRGGADPVVKESRFERGTGTFTVPARTTAVFEVRGGGRHS